MQSYGDGRTPPVDNIVGAGIRNIVGRVLRKEYEAVPRADQRRPDLEAAARPPRTLILIPASNHRFTDRIADLRRAYLAALVDMPVTQR